MWKKLGESLSGDNEEQEESWLDEDSGGLCSLSTTQRIYGFAACSIAGLALMLLISAYSNFKLCLNPI
ncbi:vesicle transport protein SFT2B-like [Trifolium medium]|uniref:Vesicle transport protein SFT2B-like n=1 Tax=Trifolium medium TaxID=97028 RepID=A0A392Q998_9FABA|nr:vesicle transport protein SFT2B-like [Trifolium medium]